VAPGTPAEPTDGTFGGLAWLRATGGALSAAERRKLTRAIIAGQSGNIVGHVKLLLGRRPRSGPKWLIEPPDTAITRAAEVLCGEQPDTIAAHGARTWLFGTALAQYDSADLDDELFYAASLLHDSGLITAVTGQDFTLRSAETAANAVVAAGGSRPQAEAVAEGIARHTTPGISPSRGGELATYLQAGALLDLAGVRAWDISETFVTCVVRASDRRGFESAILKLISAESTAVPHGRFALLKRWGLPLAITTSPFSR
jgi:hypothetical protein